MTIKTNYKQNDKVTITESISPVNGYSGTVISNETDPNYKQKRLKVELDNGLGVWHFNYNDVELENEAKIKPQEETKQKSGIVTQVKDKKSVKQAKTQPTKKTQEKQAKRKYTKRVKPVTE